MIIFVLSSLYGPARSSGAQASNSQDHASSALFAQIGATAQACSVQSDGNGVAICSLIGALRENLILHKIYYRNF